MELSDKATLYLLTGVAAYLGFVALRLWWRNAVSNHRARRRQKKATEGERKAIRLLQSAGYEILQTQARAPVRVRVNGKPQDYEARADLLVQRHGRRFVAEVKTGGMAPSLTHGPTRRQLLEYSLAYPVAGVLLVDATAGAIHRVEFPDAKRATRPAWGPVAAAFVLGALLCHYAGRVSSTSSADDSSTRLDKQPVAFGVTAQGAQPAAPKIGAAD